jgi:hypothetical protein
VLTNDANDVRRQLPWPRGQHRKKTLPANSSFVRAQFISEPAVTALDSIKVTLGDVTIYLPLDKPLQTAQLIKALQ